MVFWNLKPIAVFHPTTRVFIGKCLPHGPMVSPSDIFKLHVIEALQCRLAVKLHQTHLQGWNPDGRFVATTPA